MYTRGKPPIDGGNQLELRTWLGLYEWIDRLGEGSADETKRKLTLKDQEARAEDRQARLEQHRARLEQRQAHLKLDESSRWTAVLEKKVLGLDTRSIERSMSCIYTLRACARDGINCMIIYLDDELPACR
jgi:hypothetical protein